MGDEIKAEFRVLREGVGQIILEGLRRDVQAVERRARTAGAIYWTKAEKMPIDLFSYIREAAHCFTFAYFLGSIMLASSAVELILNRDSSVRNQIGPGWLSLSNSNLRDAEKWGLPVSVLLSSGETLDSGTPIRFVSRRNDVGHGDVLDWLRTLSDYDPSAEAEALDQLMKSQKFVIQWFNAALDVQGCHIQNHRWPSSP